MSSTLDFYGAMENLLREAQLGRIADRKRVLEEKTIKNTFTEIFASWDKVFPPFPKCHFRRRSVAREFMKGQRDTYLVDIITACAQLVDQPNSLIVNLAAVLGSKAKQLAQTLPQFDVLATDIEPGPMTIYNFFTKNLKNYRFFTENIYQPDLNRRPSIVVFFGACGSLTDASMQYTIDVKAPFLICRACCHDNTGGNIDFTKRWSLTSLLASLKNKKFLFLAKKTPGAFFCDFYDKTAYPRSKVAKALMSTETFMDIVRNCADSDIYRFIIDLDRCLYLQEYGYHVMYREELFFAHKYVGKNQSETLAHE